MIKHGGNNVFVLLVSMLLMEAIEHSFPVTFTLWRLVPFCKSVSEENGCASVCHYQQVDQDECQRPLSMLALTIIDARVKKKMKAKSFSAPYISFFSTFELV